MTPERRARVIDYQKTFGSEHGLRVLADLSRECNENRSTFERGRPDVSAFLEGGRSVILYIRGLVEADLDEEPKKTEALSEKEPDNV